MIFNKSDLVYVLSLVFCLAAPSRLDQASYFSTEDTFIKIQQPLAIVSHKNYPPYLAHLETAVKTNAETDPVVAERVYQLSTADFSATAKYQLATDRQRIVLDEVRFTKSELAKNEIIEPSSSLAEETTEQFENNEKDWVQELPKFQRLRMELAQQKTDLFNSEAQASFSQSGVFRGSQPQGRVKQPDSPALADRKKPNAPEELVKDQAIAKIERDISGEDEETIRTIASFRGLKDSTTINLTGAIEMTGGLAVTHEHSIDIRRIEEGIFRERGQVNLVDGTYTINIPSATGQIVARLLDREGLVLGEGQFRIDGTSAEFKRQIHGPKLTLKPKRALSGAYYSQYQQEQNKNKPEAVASIFQGTEAAKIDVDQKINDSRIGQGSRTVVSVDAKGFLTAQKIAVSGDEFKMSLLPQKMVSSLREIVSEQRQQDLNDPSGTLIWGQVKLDGKPLSGVSVAIESAPDIEPVYLNEFFLPDPNLKTTSSNGYFAFMQVEPGMTALIARRGSKYFSHANVVVEKETVSLAEIQNSISSKLAQVKSFDAFSGAPVETSLEIQSVENKIETVSGQAQVTLPDIHRMSFVHALAPAPYVPGIYQYDDNQDYIHIPLLNEAWLAQIKTGLKINEIPDTGTVVGFVGDENFETYSALENEQITKVYFDSRGRVLDSKKGAMGGGFILYNVPMGVNEVIIYGERTEKFYSQVVAIDPNTLNVLSFHSEY